MNPKRRGQTGNQNQTTTPKNTTSFPIFTAPTNSLPKNNNNMKVIELDKDTHQNEYYYITDTMKPAKRTKRSKFFKTNKRQGNYFATQQDAGKVAHELKKILKKPNIIKDLHEYIVYTDNQNERLRSEIKRKDDLITSYEKINNEYYKELKRSLKHQKEMFNIDKNFAICTTILACVAVATMILGTLEHLNLITFNF